MMFHVLGTVCVSNPQGTTQVALKQSPNKPRSLMIAVRETGLEFLLLCLLWDLEFVVAFSM